MKDINIYTYQGDLGDSETIIGFYIPNGVLQETPLTQGFSYYLDQIIFDALYDNITDHNNGEIRTITNYGYSSFVVSCQPDKALENMKKMENIILCDVLPEDYEIRLPLKVPKSLQNKRIRPIEMRYYDCRCEGGLLSKSICPESNTAPGLEELSRWKSQYYIADKCIVVISGAVPRYFLNLPKYSQPGNHLPQIKAYDLCLPKHTPWRRTQLILSAYYDFSSEMILCAEAACKWLEPQLACALNNIGCRLDRVQIYPDYLSEWRLSMQCASHRELDAVSTALDAFANVPNSEAELDVVRKRTRQGYLKLAQQPVKWNMFAGYNLISGCRYHLPSLLSEETYHEQITKPQICRILSQWNKHQNLSIFATAIR